MLKGLSSNPVVRYYVLILGVAIMYFISARVGLLLAFHHTNATSVWPPSGIALAAIILFGYRAWPGIALGAIAVNIFVFLFNHATDPSTAIWVSALISTGNTAEALLGYYLLKKLTDENCILQNAGVAFRFSLIALVMCLASSAIGPAIVALAGIEAWGNYPTVWFTWWLGDVAGVLIVTPLLLSWTKKYHPQKEFKQKAEALILFLLLILLSLFLFSGSIPVGSPFLRSYLITPFLLWAALRFEVREVVTMLAVTSGIAIWGTINMEGPFASDVTQESLLSLQTYISIMSINFLILSTSIAERKNSQKKLKDIRDELEVRVQERTAELKTINESLKQKSEELLRSNTELAQFAYVASHDLQEPLRMVSMYVQLLEKRYKGKLDKDADTYIHFATDAATRMYTLINDLLTYSRIGTRQMKFQQVDCNNTIKAALKNLKTSIDEKQAKISWDKLPGINADELQMTQLFQNIIGNAVKFSADRQPEIKISAHDKDTYWQFSVSDNGIGIQKEYLSKIFVIFQRLHTIDKYPGTGIGLAICKKIVERHGGTIWAESEFGKESTFYFTIKK